MAKEDARQATEANRLYWSNEASVGEIAGKFGISRRALYELLTPRPAGVPCPECGTETVFVNRSALTSGLARCPSCETEVTVPAARGRESADQATAVASQSNGQFTPLALGSVAIMGVVVGAIATLLITRRD
jgi:ribosomal protein L37AE/L43A